MCFILEAIREIPKNQISIWTRTRLGYVFGMSCVKWRQIIRKFISDLVFYIVKPNKNFRLLDNDRRNHRLYTVFSELWRESVRLSFSWWDSIQKSLWYFVSNLEILSPTEKENIIFSMYILLFWIAKLDHFNDNFCHYTFSFNSKINGFYGKSSSLWKIY